MGTILQHIIGSLLCLALCLPLLCNIWHGLSRGRIAYHSSRRRQYCYRHKQPGLFWWLMAFFSGYVLLILYYWWHSIARHWLA